MSGFSMDERRALAEDAIADRAARAREQLEADGVTSTGPLREIEARHRRAARDHRDAPARRESDRIRSDVQRMLEVQEAGEIAVRQRDESIVQAGGLLEGSSTDPAAADKLLRHARDAVRLDRLADELGELEQRLSARVEWEPGPYEVGSPHSWLLDMTGISDPQNTDQGALGRLTRHAEDVRRALRAHDDYGRYVERVIRSRARRPDDDWRLGEQQASEELRAVTTAGGITASASAAGAFVAPAILWNAWAAWRSPYWTFAGQCQAEELPGYGMMVYLPSFSAGASVTAQTEAGAVSETDPTSTLTGYPVNELAGQVTVSQQYLDRAGPGIQGDVVLWQLLKDQLSAKVDAYALTQAIAGAQTVTNSGTFALATAGGEGGLLANLKSAKSKLTDAVGVRIRGTHLFVPSDFADYLMALADGEGRPIFSPTGQAEGERETGADGDGYTGYTIAGLTMWADDNLPQTGGNLQLVVTRPSTILLATSEPTSYLFDQAASQTLGGSPPAWSASGGPTALEAIVGVRQYAVCVPRFPMGVATITGAAYTASTFAG